MDWPSVAVIPAALGCLGPALVVAGLLIRMDCDALTAHLRLKAGRVAGLDVLEVCALGSKLRPCPPSEIGFQ